MDESRAQAAQCNIAHAFRVFLGWLFAKPTRDTSDRRRHARRSPTQRAAADRRKFVALHAQLAVAITRDIETEQKLQKPAQHKNKVCFDL